MKREWKCPKIADEWWMAAWELWPTLFSLILGVVALIVLVVIGGKSCR